MNLWARILEKHNVFRDIFVREAFAMFLFFLTFTINNTIKLAACLTIVLWIVCTIIYFIPILDQEYFRPRVIMKRLRSSKYKFLLDNGFKLVDEFILEGIYKEFTICVHLCTKEERRKKNIQYDVIVGLYNLDDCDDLDQKCLSMSGTYRIGELFFEDNCVYVIPREWSDPNFEDILDDLTNILNREGLKPLKTSTEESI